MRDALVKYIAEIEDLKYKARYEEARNKIQEYLLQYTDDYRLYEELADIYLYEGNLEQAESSMKFAQKLYPESGT